MSQPGNAAQSGKIKSRMSIFFGGGTGIELAHLGRFLSGQSKMQDPY